MHDDRQHRSGLPARKRKAPSPRWRSWTPIPRISCLTDLKLPNQSGRRTTEASESADCPRTEVAIMTGHGSIESAVDAMKLGAYDYIEKPFRVEKMRLLLQRMAEKIRLGHRKRVPARARQHRGKPRRNHRHLGEHPGCTADDFAAEGHAYSCSDFRRERHRQRTCRARDSLPRRAWRKRRSSRSIAARWSRR